MSNVKNKIEALLFSSGRRMTVEELRRITKAHPDEIRKAIAEFKEEMLQRGSSILLVDDGEDAWKLTIHDQHIPLVRKVVSKTELPKTLLETLAIVAWKAPVMQSEIIKMRTNKAYDDLRTLESRNYITRTKHGRTKLIKLAQKFFDYFDIPPDKVKEKFARFEEMEKAIQHKEIAVEDAHKKIEHMQKEHDEEQKRIENIDTELDNIPIPKIKAYGIGEGQKEDDKVKVFEEPGADVEIVKNTKDGLEVYGEEAEEKKVQEEDLELETKEESEESETGKDNEEESLEESENEEAETKERQDSEIIEAESGEAETEIEKAGEKEEDAATPIQEKKIEEDVEEKTIKAARKRISKSVKAMQDLNQEERVDSSEEKEEAVAQENQPETIKEETAEDNQDDENIMRKKKKRAQAEEEEAKEEPEAKEEDAKEDKEEDTEDKEADEKEEETKEESETEEEPQKEKTEEEKNLESIEKEKENEENMVKEIEKNIDKRVDQMLNPPKEAEQNAAEDDERKTLNIR